MLTVPRDVAIRLTEARVATAVAWGAAAVGTLALVLRGRGAGPFSGNAYLYLDLEGQIPEQPPSASELAMAGGWAPPPSPTPAPTAVPTAAPRPSATPAPSSIPA